MKSFSRFLSGCLSLTCLLLLATEGWGQELQVHAPGSVPAGQPFQLRFVVDADVDKFNPPDFGNFEVLGGPSTGRSYSMSMVNGHMENSVQVSYTYYLLAREPGRYRVGVASVMVDGRRIETSGPVEVEVLAAGNMGAPGGGPSARPGAATAARPSSGGEAKNLLLRLQLSKSKVYVGEPLMATLKIYSRVQILGFDEMKFPTFNGFLSKVLPAPEQIALVSEAYQGREYNAGKLREYVLFPQKPGEQTIDESVAEPRYIVRRQSRSIFDVAFGGGYDEATMVIKAPKQTVRVLPLPKGAPSGFGGAVGRFTVNSAVSQDSLMTNDALSYTVTLSGSGNMQLIPAPEIAFPSTVESFPPKVVEKYGLKGGTQSGSISYEYVLIPRAPGELKIPAYNFSYFDPQKEQYVTVSTPSYSLHVEAAPSADQSTASVGVRSKEEVKQLGRDIRHIHAGGATLGVLGERMVGSVGYWLWFFLLVLLFAVLWIALLRRERLRADVASVKGRRAHRVSHKRLRVAKSYLDAGDARYHEELIRALHGYLTDKLGLDKASLSADSIREQLLGRGVDAALVDGLLGLIADCEYARYSPDQSSEGRGELYERAVRSLDELNANL
ncbi:MAG: hypothetical protein CSA07_01655 [Bacteroidia bacterium]|nr:MAG: hypothetical protein CSA07_01655 [Bacteroidia bacterium]